LGCVPHEVFHHRADFDPSADFESFLKAVPGKWVVYLMTADEGRPVQLLCVRNLRASLERRLGLGEAAGDGALPAGPSRRLNYREIVRRVWWRRVDSAFEADAIYLEAARAVFPQQYRGMLGMRPAWFVHVNPHATYPRYVKTNDPTRRAGAYFGPLEDKHAAQKLVHTMENLFDLCRDYSILTQSPHAGPCPWKQMDKCVGPCDGTIDLSAYRQLVEFSMRVLADPHDYVRQQTRRMQQAATELRFETAEKIKAYVEQLSQLGKGAFRHVRPLERFRYVSIQRGPRAGTAKVFLVTPGRIDEVAGLITEPAPTGELLRCVITAAHDGEAADISAPLDESGVERIGVVVHHLFLPKARQGCFLPLDEIEEKLLLKAFRDVQNQKPQEDAIAEGVTKELQAL
jgi:hypothetical protein